MVIFTTMMLPVLPSKALVILVLLEMRVQPIGTQSMSLLTTVHANVLWPRYGL